MSFTATAAGQDIGAALSGERPFSLSGSISATAEGYLASGIDARKVPLSWTISGEPVVTLIGLSLPFSLVISEQERSFRQPFNQFGVSPRYKWATAHLGYRSLTFSPFTLAGHNFLGGGLELYPGRFRFGAMYGRLKRAVPEDTLATNQDTSDQTPSFRRTGYAVKLGWGTEANHVDLTWLRAWDDLSSIPYVPVKTEVLPGSNSALGVTVKQGFLKVCSWDMDVGASHFTRDVRADEIKPGNSTLSFITKLLGTRLSTAVYVGGSTGLGVNAGPFSARLGYRLIGPDYQSMGGYYSQGDVSALDLTSSLATLGSRVVLSGSASLQADNITRRNTYTNERFNWSAGTGLNPVPWLGCDVQYANYSTDQKPGTLVPSDSTRIMMTTHSLTVSPHSSFTTGTAGHGLSVSYSMQWVHDRNPFTRDLSRSDSRLTSASYSLSLSPQNLTLSISGTAAAIEGQTGSSSNAGVGLSASQGLFNGALTLGLAPALAWTSSADTLTALTATTTANAGWRFLARHALNATLGHTGNFARVAGTRNFSELRATLGYSLSF